MYIAVEKTDSEYVFVFFIVKYKVNKLQKSSNTRYNIIGF